MPDLAKPCRSNCSHVALVDSQLEMAPGQLLTQWQAALDANTLGLPRPAIKVFGCTNVIFILINKGNSEAHFFFVQAIF